MQMERGVLHVLLREEDRSHGLLSGIGHLKRTKFADAHDDTPAILIFRHDAVVYVQSVIIGSEGVHVLVVGRTVEVQGYVADGSDVDGREHHVACLRHTVVVGIRRQAAVVCNACLEHQSAASTYLHVCFIAKLKREQQILAPAESIEFPFGNVERLKHFERCSEVADGCFLRGRVADVVNHHIVCCIGMIGREHAEHGGGVAVVRFKRILIGFYLNSLSSFTRRECHHGSFIPRLVQVAQRDAGLIGSCGSLRSAELNPDFVRATIRVGDHIVWLCINHIDVWIVRVSVTAREGDDIFRLCQGW